MKKGTTFFLIMGVLLGCFFTAKTVISQGKEFTLPPEILKAMQEGVLITPEGGLICLKSKRPTGTLDFQPANESGEVISLTGDCPYESGCTVVRSQASKESKRTDQPILVEYTNVPLRGPQHPESNVDCKDSTVPVPALLPKGPVNICITVQGLDSHKHYFFFAKGTNPIQSPTIDEEQTQEIPAGNNNALQQNQLAFTQGSEASTPTEGEEQQCTFVAWDPYGRVFDTKSLEPLPGIKVSLIDNDTQEPVIQMEKNFDDTEEDGLYNILVNRPGLYKIRAAVPPNYTYISNPILHPGYSKMYSDLYYPETVYEEKQGIPTHHDIPFQPNGAPYYSEGVTVMNNASGINLGNYWLYTGRVSHPFAYVCLVGEKTNKIYGCDIDQASKYGSYMITVNQSNFPAYESMIPIGSKTPIPLSGLNTDDPKFKTSLRNNPLFGYIEGYAKDKKGDILPNAKVQVLYSANDRLMYEVQADASGFFKFYPQELPFTEYYLYVISPITNNGFAVSTAHFAVDNKAYLEAKNISLTTNREEMLLLSQSKITEKDNTSASKPYKSRINSTPETAQVIPQNNNTLKVRYLIVAIMASVLLGAGVIIYFLLSKKKNTS